MLSKGKQKQARRGQMTVPRLWMQFCLKNIRFCKIKAVLTGLSLDVSLHLPGRWLGGAVLTVSCSELPFHLLPFSHYFLRETEDRVLSSENNGEFPRRQNVSLSETFMYHLFILQLQVKASD